MGKILRDWRWFNYTVLCSKYFFWLGEVVLERPREFKLKGILGSVVKPCLKTDFLYHKKYYLRLFSYFKNKLCPLVVTLLFLF